MSSVKSNLDVSLLALIIYLLAFIVCHQTVLILMDIILDGLVWNGLKINNGVLFICYLFYCLRGFGESVII